VEIATFAPADGHAVYSIGLGRSGVKAYVNGSEVRCTDDPTSGCVSLHPTPGALRRHARQDRGPASRRLSKATG